MAPWTPQLETLIRDLGEYVDTQMKDLLDPKGNSFTTSTRLAFRHASTGASAMKNACREAGWEFKGEWLGDLKKLCDLAEANSSDSAAKIKKALPVANELTSLFSSDDDSGSIRKKVKLVKAKGIQY